MTISKEQSPQSGHWAILNPGRADQYRAEAKAARVALGLDPESEQVSPKEIADAISSKQAARIAELEHALSEQLEGSFTAPPGYVMVPNGAVKEPAAFILQKDMERLGTGEYWVAAHSAEALREDCRKYVPLYRHPAPEQQPEILDDDSLARQIGEIGNQVHNLGCDHQNDEDLSERLATLACALWGLAEMAPAQAQKPAAPPYQERVADWMQKCFGPVISADRMERNHRFLEESLELVQALGCSEGEAHALVRYVFGRPAGKPDQEVGGVRVTLSALCNASDIDEQAAAEAELTRISEPDMMARIAEKQRRKPAMSPLPGSYPERNLAPQPAVPEGYPLGALVNGQELHRRLAEFYNFECESGPLKNCTEYQELAACFDALLAAAPQPDGPHKLVPIDPSPERIDAGAKCLLSEDSSYPAWADLWPARFVAEARQDAELVYRAMVSHDDAALKPDGEARRP